MMAKALPGSHQTGFRLNVKVASATVNGLNGFCYWRFQPAKGEVSAVRLLDASRLMEWPPELNKK